MNETRERPSTRFAGGLRLVVKAKLGSKQPGRPRLVDLAGEGRAIEIPIAEIAEDGKANRALITRLAQALNIDRQTITLKTGASGRLKRFEITGNPDELEQKLDAWMTE